MNFMTVSNIVFSNLVCPFQPKDRLRISSLLRVSTLALLSFSSTILVISPEMMNLEKMIADKFSAAMFRPIRHNEQTGHFWKIKSKNLQKSNTFTFVSWLFLQLWHILWHSAHWYILDGGIISLWHLQHTSSDLTNHSRQRPPPTGVVPRVWRRWSSPFEIEPSAIFRCLHSRFFSILSNSICFLFFHFSSSMIASCLRCSLSFALTLSVISILLSTRFICLPRLFVKSSNSFLRHPPKLSSPLQKPNPI